LRHSHASVLLGQGVPLPIVSQRLEHANPNITLGVYSHALPADVKAASKAWHIAKCALNSMGYGLAMRQVEQQ